MLIKIDKHTENIIQKISINVDIIFNLYRELHATPRLEAFFEHIYFSELLIVFW